MPAPVLQMPARKFDGFPSFFPGPMWLFDKHRRFCAVSEHYSQFAGKSAAEVIGRTPTEVWGERVGAERNEIMDEAERTGRPIVRRVVMELPTGRYWLLFISPVAEGFACGLLPIPL